jgi:hypothetical protein
MASAFAKRLASVASDQHTSFTSCTAVPWSAVFVSWCVQRAGATKKEFKLAMPHSVFVQQAIKNAAKGEGVFHGVEISAELPAVGDIIQHNRGGASFDFAFAKTHSSYQSHSVIVIEEGTDSAGRFAFCIGGNESDSVRRSTVRLDARGFIKQRSGNSFIALVKNRK